MVRSRRKGETMLQYYRTIRKDGQHETEIKKSRFICSLKRVENEEDALAFIAEVKKEHSKANHNCSAYLIGEQDDIQRAHDDGEPSGTAGVPMLEVLKKKELKNVAVVVTRYFGGIKLGTGGLIRAYGGAVSAGLEEVGLVEGRRQLEITATVDYTFSGKLENNLRGRSYTIKDIQYTDKVAFNCLVEEGRTDRFYDDVTEWTNGQAVFETNTWIYVETPFDK